jgi:hypothetical protein
VYILPISYNTTTSLKHNIPYHNSKLLQHLYLLFINCLAIVTKYKTIYNKKLGGILLFTENDEDKVSGEKNTLIKRLLNVY